MKNILKKIKNNGNIEEILSDIFAINSKSPNCIFCDEFNFVKENNCLICQECGMVYDLNLILKQLKNEVNLFVKNTNITLHISFEINLNEDIAFFTITYNYENFYYYIGANSLPILELLLILFKKVNNHE